jgi:quinohemoprotein ethanol dehydrogenase
MRWRAPGGGGIGGGTLTTAANLVFQTLGTGRLLAYTADGGHKLLDLDTGLRSGMGPPITYRLDGRQFIAVMGNAGPAGGGVSPELQTLAVPQSVAVPRTAVPR